MTPSRTLWLGLPAYNEEEAIIPLLERVDKERPRLSEAGWSLEVLVVDDGSKDRTAAKVIAFRATHPYVTLVSHPANRGLGAGLNTLLQEAASRGKAGDCLVMMDADDTHEPASMLEMVRRMEASGAEVAIASRFVPGAREGGVTALRRFFSRGASLLYSLVLPYGSVRDYTCGYRVYDLSFIQRAIALEGQLVHQSGFEATTELLLQLRSLGATAVEYPIDLAYERKGGESKMNITKTIRGHLHLIWLTWRQGKAATRSTVAER